MKGCNVIHICSVHIILHIPLQEDIKNVISGDSWDQTIGPLRPIRLPARFITKCVGKLRMVAILPAAGPRTAPACQGRQPVWTGPLGVPMKRWTTALMKFSSYIKICKGLHMSVLFGLQIIWLQIIFKTGTQLCGHVYIPFVISLIKIKHNSSKPWKIWSLKITKLGCVLRPRWASRSFPAASAV